MAVVGLLPLYVYSISEIACQLLSKSNSPCSPVLCLPRAIGDIRMRCARSKGFVLSPRLGKCMINIRKQWARESRRDRPNRKSECCSIILVYQTTDRKWQKMYNVNH